MISCLPRGPSTRSYRFFEFFGKVADTYNSLPLRTTWACYNHDQTSGALQSLTGCHVINDSHFQLFISLISRYVCLSGDMVVASAGHYTSTGTASLGIAITTACKTPSSCTADSSTQVLVLIRARLSDATYVSHPRADLVARMHVHNYKAVPVSWCAGYR